MVKLSQIEKLLKKLILVSEIFILILLFLAVGANYLFEYSFRGKIYPGVKVAGVNFGGRTPEELTAYFRARLVLPSGVAFIYEDNSYPLDLPALNLHFNTRQMSSRAYSVGRQTDNFYNNLVQKIAAFSGGIDLPAEIAYDGNLLSETEGLYNRSIAVTPVDAQFKFEPEAGPDHKGRVVAFAPSRNGREIDHEKLLNIFTSLITGQTCAGETECLLPLPVTTITPKVNSTAADSLGLKDLLGSGTSYFYDSIPGRVDNIRIGAEKISGSLIAPGETFSFDNSIGTISAVFGFQKAYIIKNNKTVLDDGGGVCQVSTTLYRAALNAGLPIIERVAHSYRVGFYEQGGFKPGLDATVYPPSPDLKFENDTPGWILLQATFDQEKSQLTFDLFGTADGRKTKISDPVILSSTPPPDPIYEDAPNLPVGIVQQVDTAHSGAKVFFKRTVTRNGEVLIDETVTSDYVPWPARFLRGTKAN